MVGKETFLSAMGKGGYNLKPYFGVSAATHMGTGRVFGKQSLIAWVKVFFL